MPPREPERFSSALSLSQTTCYFAELDVLSMATTGFKWINTGARACRVSGQLETSFHHQIRSLMPQQPVQLRLSTSTTPCSA